MYLVLQALLVVCVYLMVECYDCQAMLEVTIYNHYVLIKNNLTLFCTVCLCSIGTPKLL